MALGTNLTSTSTLSPTVKTYYDKRLLEEAKATMPFHEFGAKKVVPKNSGKTVQFRRFQKFPVTGTALTEGTIPDGMAINIDEVTATVAGYGAYAATSELLDMTALDPIITELAPRLGENGGMNITKATTNVIFNGTSVMYAGGRSSRATLVSGDALTLDDIKKAVTILKKDDAPRIRRGGREYYVAFIHPSAVYEIWSDSEWIDVHKYAASENIFTGEVGRMYGVIFIESTTVPVVRNADDTLNIAQTLIVGRDAYAVIDVLGGKGSNPNQISTVVKPRGSSGIADPLDQIATVGWKVDAFACAILNQDFMIRIESVATI
jgi:N4-gp56 family major capsid protein